MRGYHAYMEIWTPVVLVVKREPTDRHDIHAVAIYSIFFYESEQSICRNHRSQRQQGSWLWSGSLPSIYYPTIPTYSPMYLEKSQEWRASFKFIHSPLSMATPLISWLTIKSIDSTSFIITINDCQQHPRRSL